MGNGYLIFIKYVWLIMISLNFGSLTTYAHELPDLGDLSQATITSYQERQIGLKIMRQIPADPNYLDDPESSTHLSNLGHKLISNSDEAKASQLLEFFTIQDPAINTFALPGRFMGFNSVSSLRHKVNLN